MLDKYIEKKRRMVFGKANLPLRRGNASESRMAEVILFK